MADSMRAQRQLAAILAADIAGFSRLKDAESHWAAAANLAGAPRRHRFGQNRRP
jgi:hypothetical protein